MYDKSAIANSADLWQRYGMTKDTSLRNELVMLYGYIVSCTVAKMRTMCTAHGEIEDLVNQGYIALIDSVERFNPARGVKFETFASIRVRGAIIDYVRKQDIVPRRVRKASREIDNAFSLLWTRFGREPTEEEVAQELNIEVTQLRKLSTDIFNANVLYFDEMLMDSEAGMPDLPATTGGSTLYQPEAYVQEGEFKKILINAIDSLGEKEKTAISLYYYEKLKLKEIAYVLGVSESRVCQIHGAAINKMRKYLDKNY